MKKSILRIILFLFPFLFEGNAQINPGFAAGADASWVTEMESSGKIFRDSSGTARECLSLLKSLGMNTIRLRIWVDPQKGWCGTEDFMIKARRVHELGMRLMVDFHYSDYWADPGKQNKPAAWTSLNFPDLCLAVKNHTTDILTRLKQENIEPEWVQVGNETGNGMLWEDGKASKSMYNYIQLSNAGYEGVKSVFPDCKVIVHLQNGNDNNLFRWIFDGFKNNGGKWDVIGMSLYPSWSGLSWQDANSKCLMNMKDMITRYGKEIMIVETGMSWDQAATCKLFLEDLINKVNSLPDSKGLGVLYWEPECFASWNGYNLGAFDNSGKPTVALDAFKIMLTELTESRTKDGIRYLPVSNKIILENHPDSCSVYNIQGKLLNFYIHPTEIPTDKLDNGIYFLIARKGNYYQTFKLLIS